MAVASGMQCLAQAELERRWELLVADEEAGTELIGLKAVQICVGVRHFFAPLERDRL